MVGNVLGAATSSAEPLDMVITVFSAYINGLNAES
jgi:hypothetical protein